MFAIRDGFNLVFLALLLAGYALRWWFFWPARSPASSVTATTKPLRQPEKERT